jgi:excisionase family DNA binding protein
MADLDALELLELLDVRRLAYTVPEVQVVLGGVSRPTVYKLLNDGTLPSTMVGPHRLVYRAGLEAFLASRASRPADHTAAS